MVNNDLSKFKSDVDNSKNDLPTSAKKPSAGVGRKAKAVSEKASKPITLKFTESELAIIEKKSGLIPNATYLKELLVKQSDLFK